MLPSIRKVKVSFQTGLWVLSLTEVHFCPSGAVLTVSCTYGSGMSTVIKSIYHSNSSITRWHRETNKASIISLTYSNKFHFVLPSSNISSRFGVKELYIWSSKLNCICNNKFWAKLLKQRFEICPQNPNSYARRCQGSELRRSLFRPSVEKVFDLNFITYNSLSNHWICFLLVRWLLELDMVYDLPKKNKYIYL